MSDLAGAGDDLALVCGLANAGLATSEAAVGRSLTAAEDLRTALASVSWGIIEAGANLTDTRQPAAEALRSRLAEALAADEHVVPLRPALKDAEGRASRLLAEAATSPPLGGASATASSQPAASQPPLLGEEVVGEGDRPSLDAGAAAAVLEDLRRQLTAIPGSRLTLRWRLTKPADGASA